jgi:hypothetical protein
MFDCAFALPEFSYALVAGYPGLSGKSTIPPGADNALCERISGCVATLVGTGLGC